MLTPGGIYEQSIKSGLSVSVCPNDMWGELGGYVYLQCPAAEVKIN